MQSYKMSYIIHADIETLTKKMGNCENNPEKSSTTEIAEHVPYGYSMSPI